MKKILTINIETKSRELNSRMMIAYEALKRDYILIIGAQDEITKLIPYLPDSIFFEKSISKNKLKKLTKIKRFGHKIVNLDEEGMASQNNKHFYLKQRLSKNTLDLIEYFFTWGDNEKKLIEDNYQEYKYKVKTTGNPRIDAWKPDYIEFYKDEIYQINQKYKNYIFIASNFASLQHARGNEFIIKQGKDYQKIETKEDEEIINLKQIFFNKVYIAFLDMIKYLSKSLPNETIVIRPHPGDNFQIWKENFKEYDNIHIEYKFSATPWIIASECMIHSSCTTGIEGFFTKRPVFSYLPYNDHEFINYIANSLSDICNTKHELLDKIQDVFSEKYKVNSNFSSKILEAKPILENADFIGSAKKILEYIDNIEISKHKKINKLRFFLAKIGDIIKTNIKKLMGQKQIIDNYYIQKMPGIKKNEIYTILNQLKIVDNQLEAKEFEVQEVFKDVFLIKSF